MKKQLFMLSILLIGTILTGHLVAAQRTFGNIYLEGETVRTFGVQANLPQGGTDPLYVVTNGVQNQLGIAGTGPGQQGFHGGAWAYHEVTFTQGTAPYLLTSNEEVQQAEQAGEVQITRIQANDFRCPVLP